ncbi:fimbrial protein [Enterobacterales bacterium CwR94]|nr:fimbrial protein [Enterobacterales bacterium CwR94]
MKIINIILFFCLSFPALVQAYCSKVTNRNQLSADLISKGYTASNWNGACFACNGDLGLPSVISLSMNNTFLPAGSVLAASSPSFLTSASNNPFNANAILYRCDLGDADKLYEIYGSNSTYNVTGDTPAEDIEGAYLTASRNIAVRFTNTITGEYYTAYWKSRKLGPDSWIQDDKYIYIPVTAFSAVHVEVLKTASTRAYNNSNNYYFYNESPPQGLIAFRGPGLGTSNIRDGEHLGRYHPSWPGDYPGGFSLYNIVTIVRGAACRIKDYPSVILFPTMSSAALNSGESVQRPFSIDLTCEDKAISSTNRSNNNTANVAMGFLVKQPNAVAAAKKLRLISGSGLTHLLDSNYGSPGVASGVGIRIYDEKGKALTLLASKATATGNAAGWYAYKDITTDQGDSEDGISTFKGNFTASLEVINGQKATAGSIDSQLQVVVSFQ